MSAMNDVVISGMSGRFPLSNNNNDLSYDLNSGVDMISEYHNRWPKGTNVNIMSAQTDIGCELMFEAFRDAGVVSNTLSDCNIGVFIDIAEGLSSAQATDVEESIKSLIDRIVIIFDIKRPNFTIDTTNTSDLMAIHAAVDAIRNKRCDKALVLRIATNDCNAKGVTSMALLLQKRSEAKRVYVTVVHTKSSGQGLDEMGLTEPPLRKRCLVGNKPQGTDETEQTLGADKSGICHTKGSSGLTSLIEVMIDLEDNDMHRNVVNRDNCFVCRDTKVEVIVRADSKWPSDENNDIVDKIPRLVLMCGRSEEELKHTFNCITNSPKMLTRDYLSLINDISKTTSLDVMKYRGFAILDKTDDKNDIQMNIIDVKKVSNTKPQIWYIIAGLGTQWPTMGRELMKIDICAQSIRASAEVLQEYDINLMALLLENNENLMQCPMNVMISLAATQIALIDLLDSLAIAPDGIVGICFGELLTAYVDKCISAAEVLKIAYFFTKDIIAMNKTRGAFVSVFQPLSEVMAKKSDNIHIAVDVDDDWVVITGEEAPVNEYVQKLKADNVFTFDINSFGLPLHSPLITDIREPMITVLKNVIPNRRMRSHKWISSTFDESDRKYRFFSAEYFTELLILPAHVTRAYKHIPKRAVVIEIGPHNMLKHIFAQADASEMTYVPLMTRNANNIQMILHALGSLYMAGAVPCIERLYPAVTYPVSRGTP